MSAEGRETSRQHNARAFSLISSRPEGVTWNELRDQHLAGAPSVLVSLGMIHRKKDKSRGWVYYANKRPAQR